MREAVKTQNVHKVRFLAIPTKRYDLFCRIYDVNNNM